METELKEKLLKEIKKIEHPEINFTLWELGMLSSPIFKENAIEIKLKLPFFNVPIKNLLISSIKKSIQKIEKNIEVNIQIEEMSKEEKEKFFNMAKSGWKY